MTKKTLYFDLETTGIDEKRNSVIQFAGIIEYDDVEVDRIDIKMQPFDEAEIEDSALDKCNLTIDDLLERQSHHDGFLEVIRFLNKHVDKFDKTDKLWVAGYNIMFDLRFLNEFFQYNGEKFGPGSYINWKFIDAFPMIHIMAWRGKINLKNHKLSTVCEAFGIPLTNAHDAMSDIEATRTLIKKLFVK